MNKNKNDSYKLFLVNILYGRLKNSVHNSLETRLYVALSHSLVLSILT